MKLPTTLACFVSIVYSVSEMKHSVDPEIFLNNSEIIRYWGYPAEEITATTEDGYILGMQRIPHGKNESTGNGSCRPIIFLLHGLENDATNWAINLPHQSAAYIFADAGFDVWMGNTRGNTYSRNHAWLSSSDEKFWEFSWDEIAQYDIPAMIETVLNITGQNSLYYIGHSQGTLTMFAKLSTDPIFSKKIKKFFAFAPVGSVKHIKGILPYMANLFTEDAELFDNLFGSMEFTPSNWATKLLSQFVCGTFIGQRLCDGIMESMIGPNTDQFNATRSDVYFAHNPAGTSSRNVFHWSQMVKYGTVSRFDYADSKKNEDKYGTSIPPPYNFSAIATDMYLYWSDEDFLADPVDVQGYLLPSLNKDFIKQNNRLSGFSHMDYVWGLRAADVLYKPIINLIKEELGGNIGC